MSPQMQTFFNNASLQSQNVVLPSGWYTTSQTSSMDLYLLGVSL